MSTAREGHNGPPEPPIIVVRRVQAEHEEHHGGVWKIAYADFMTAMMAFFLVMWLVNASSEETKAAVASYFNPIELTDRNARPRGLDDPKPGPTDGSSSAGEAEGGSVGSPGGPLREIGVDASRADGASARANAARAEEPMPVNARDATDRAGPQTGASGGEAHRDPFSPDYWNQAMGEVDLAAAVLSDEPAADGTVTVDTVSAEVLAGPSDRPRDGVDAADASGASSGRNADVRSTEPPGNDAVQGPAVSPAIEALAAEIAAELADAGRAAAIDVVARPGEVVIRLADDPERAMFPIGSAAPAARLADDIARVVEALQRRPGRLAVHGHTDARPFRGDPEGNWDLSARRAEAARRLLLRAGLPRERVVEVVAHADGSPREGLEPAADGNRRIELRLRPEPGERS